ncbi:f-box domain-containing protein [Gigaspora margarita]|uniref:F-box domain-containing protein n=1 Tax=Gigaspora margarita TaxID=4874 RepID=A0A8H4B068_GIGMA|nr:f-box domain-containing protein [Gigaspora margarita]
MILLPNECLFNIFINLKDNYKTLFSCLLVNRQWCRIVVPILWSKLDISNNLVLVKNCLLTLNKEEKELLKQFEIIIPDNPKSKPLFEYVSYCEVIKLNSDNGIINWLNYEKYGPCDLEATTKFGEMVYWITHLWHGHRDLTYNPYSERSKNMVKTIKYTLIKMFLRTKKVITLKSFNTLLGSEVDLMIEAVHKNIALKRLILRNNQLCNEVGEAFAKALYNNTMLIQLSFSGNNLNSEGNEINYQVRVKLINTLQKKKILTDLNRNRRDSLPCLVS